MFSLFLRVCAGAIAYLTLSIPALAATGDWDYSYGTNGRLTLTVPGGTFDVRSWRPQTGGRIVAIGTVAGQGVTVARFHENGTLDTAFDGDGVLTMPWSSSVNQYDLGLELQPDGRLLVSAHQESFNGGAYQSTFRLRRLNTDGSLDITFANGGEFSQTSAYMYRAQVSLTSAGSIVLVGGALDSATQSGRVTRLTSNGILDTTFGGTGTVQFMAPGPFFVSSFVTNPDGSLTVGGSVGPFNAAVPFVARVTADGGLDPAFGDSGVLVMEFLSGTGEIYSVLAAADGKVYAAGTGDDIAGNPRPFVARIDANGALDATFGSGGRIVTNGTAVSLTLEADGKLLLAGATTEFSAGLAWAARYNVDGSPDVTFGLRGRSRLDLSLQGTSYPSQLRDIVRYPDGSYRALAQGNGAASLVRLLGTGASAGVVSARTNASAQLWEHINSSVFASIYRTGGNDGVVSVRYRAVSDTATVGEDFVATTGMVTFNDGEVGPKGVFIPLIDDDLYENDETFHLELFDPTGGAALALSQVNYTISASPENDTDVSFATSAVAVTEGAGSARLIVRRTGSLFLPLTVNYSTSIPGMVGTDFNGGTGSIGWAANEGGTRFIDFPIIDDAVAEPTETFNVMLSSGTVDAVEQGATSVTIVDDDDASLLPSVAFSNTVASVSEAASSVSLTVERLGDPTAAVSANWNTTSWLSTAADGEDYVAASGTLSWNAGDTTPRTIVIALSNDSFVETLETLHVVLVGTAPLQTSEGHAFVYIEDDEPPAMPLVVSLQPGTSVSEGAGSVTATVTISGTPQAPVSVNLSGSPGTATHDDLAIPATTLNWAIGDASPKIVIIPITQDARDEIDEKFTLSLYLPNGATIGTASTSFTILDDDPTPPGQPAPVYASIRAPVSAFTVSEAQQVVRFQLERVGEINTYIFAQFSVTRGDATNPDDYYGSSGLVQWNSGDTTSREFEVQLNGDMIAEPTETFTVAVYNDPLVPLAEITFTVLDDDAPSAPARVGFTSAAQTIAESATTVTLSLGRTGNTSMASSVDYATASGTAGASDFVASTGTLTWAPNDSSSKLVTVALTPDTAGESDETFTVTLRNPTAGTEFDIQTTTVTIIDDEVVIVAPPPPGGGGNTGGGGGGGGEESLVALLLWGALASLRRARARPPAEVTVLTAATSKKFHACPPCS